MPTYGTNNAWGMPTEVEFSFNGASTPWGTANLYSMAPLSNKAESVDGSYEISDLDVELIDTNGSIWGSLGHGTTAFNKEFSATVYLGGDMGNTAYGPSSLNRLKKQSNLGAATYYAHQGKIVDVSYKNRMVRIKSQNNLKRISDLEWRFPYHQGNALIPQVLGSYIFYTTNYATFRPESIYDTNEEGNRFKTTFAVATSSIDGWSVTYPSISGKGTLGRSPFYFYPGTAFYEAVTLSEFEGTWMDGKTGTINDDDDARRYGFSSAAVANAAGTYVSGTYLINKTRFHMREGTLGGTHLYPQQNLVLTETPANLFRELVAGHCVTPYFGTTDIEQSSFATSQRNTVYQTFSQRIDPKGGKVVPYIKDILDSTFGVFSVTTGNQFEYRAYGPRNLNQAIGSINGTDILESSVSNNIKDAKNRVVLKYNYSPDSGGYNKQIEQKGTPWSGTTDEPFVVESKWLQDDNEARLFAKRLLARYGNTIPHVEVRVPLKYAGAGLGSLYSITDPDSGLVAKTFEITEYSKDFTEGRDITFRGIDGDSIYNRRGFGFWMAGTLIPSGVVSGTSTLGWGTSGTQANINTAVFGSMFSWW